MHLESCFCFLVDSAMRFYLPGCNSERMLMLKPQTNRNCFPPGFAEAWPLEIMVSPFSCCVPWLWLCFVQDQ